MSLLYKLPKDVLIKLLEESQDTIAKLKKENTRLHNIVVSSTCGKCKYGTDSDHLYSCRGQNITCPNRVCERCSNAYGQYCADCAEKRCEDGQYCADCAENRCDGGHSYCAEND